MDGEHLLIAMPTRGVPHPRAFNAMMSAANRCTTANVMFPDGAPRDHNRNCIVQYFLDQHRHDWLLMIDDDSVVPPDVIELLFSVGKKVVAAPQPLYFAPEALVVNLARDHGPAGDDYVWPSYHNYDFSQPPYPLLACGFGCVLMHRDVLEPLERPWFQEHYGDYYGRGGITEDVWFCRRVLEMGAEIWSCPSASCGHYKWVDLRDIMPRAALNIKGTGPSVVMNARENDDGK